MKKIVVLVVLTALFLIVSCDSGIKFDNPLDEHNQEAQTDAGTLGKECYKNKTCNKGLICDEETNTCIEESATEPTEDPTE